MSLVIDLIGELNCHVIGCKTRKSRLVHFDPSKVFWGPFLESPENVSGLRSHFQLSEF